MLDEGGNVIGVATLIKEDGQNLNFAIPVEKVSALLSYQGIALPEAEAPSEKPSSPGGGTSEKSSTIVPDVLMVTAKYVLSQTNATFQENGGFLVFFGNGRSVAASIGKPEYTEIGHAINFKPGITRSSTGEWYLPYPLALTIRAFLYPGFIRPKFAPDSFYLFNVSDKGSQESQKTETLISALSHIDRKLFAVSKRTPPSSGRFVLLFLRIVPPQAGGPDCAVSVKILAPHRWIKETFA